jgi:hypothetical protein
MLGFVPSIPALAVVLAKAAGHFGMAPLDVRSCVPCYGVLLLPARSQALSTKCTYRIEPSSKICRNHLVLVQNVVFPPSSYPPVWNRKIGTGYYLATPAATLHRAVRLTQQTRNGAALGRPESPAHLAPQCITSAARRPSSSGRLRCRRSEL